MILSAFHTEVRNTIKRGTTLDTQIVSATRRAARWIERNYTFKYMESFQSTTISSGVSEPRAINFPTAYLKSIEFFRLILDVDAADVIERYAYLTLVDGREIGSDLVQERPQRYWIDGGNSRLWLDNSPDQNYDAEIFYKRYTEWPTDTTAEPWLLLYAEDLMLAQTLLQLDTSLRDEKMRMRAEKLSAEALRTLELADEEMVRTNREEVMLFGTAYEDED